MLDLEKIKPRLDRLKQLRTKTDLVAPPNDYLRTHFANGSPLTLRTYQVQGIMHLVTMERFVLGDDTGLGKTLQTIASLTYVWQKDPTIPVLILTTKSAVGQWASEFDKFTTGVTVHICQGTKAKREKVYSAFEKASTPKVLVMGYRTACQDFAYLQKMHSMVTVFDEATAFKNDTSQVHQVCAHLSGASLKVWSLSATIIKNKLMEAWAIYKVTVPGLFF